jgi:hypothetical protein
MLEVLGLSQQWTVSVSYGNLHDCVVSRINTNICHTLGNISVTPVTRKNEYEKQLQNKQYKEGTIKHVRELLDNPTAEEEVDVSEFLNWFDAPSDGWT